MSKCPTCQSEISSDNPGINLIAITEYVSSHGGWTMFEEEDLSRFTLVSGKVVNVVARKVTYDTGDLEDTYSYYELPQGTEFDTHVILEVDGAFFKKTGSGDSYGRVDWNGELVRVYPQTVEKVFYTE